MNRAADAGGHAHVRRLLKNTLAFGVAGLAAQTSFVLAEVVIARRLGQGAYGIFTSAFVLSSVMLFVLDLGTQFKLVEDGARDRTQIPTLLGTSLVFKSSMFVLAYPLVVWGASLSGLNPPAVAFITLFFPYALVMLLHETLSSVYVARQQMEVSAFFQSLNAILILALTSTGLYAVAQLEVVAYAYVSTGLVIAAVWAWLCFRSVRPRIRLGALPRILAGSWLYSLHGLLTQLFQRLDILLLAVFRPMPEVGLYAAGYKLLDLGFKLPIMAVRVVAPVLFEQWAQDARAYDVINNAMLRMATLGGLMVSLVLFLCAEPIIGVIFGDDYEDAGAILQIVSATFAAKFMYIGLETTLTTSNRHRQRTVALALITGLAIIGYPPLIIHYGLMGAAFGRLAWDLLLLVTLAWTLRAEINVLRLLGAPVAAAILLAALSDYTGLAPQLQAALAVIGLAITLLGTRYVTREECRYLVAALKAGGAKGAASQPGDQSTMP